MSEMLVFVIMSVMACFLVGFTCFTVGVEIGWNKGYEKGWKEKEFLDSVEDTLREFSDKEAK